MAKVGDILFGFEADARTYSGAPLPSENRIYRKDKLHANEDMARWKAKLSPHDKNRVKAWIQQFRVVAVDEKGNVTQIARLQG